MKGWWWVMKKVPYCCAYKKITMKKGKQQQQQPTVLTRFTLFTSQTRRRCSSEKKVGTDWKIDKLMNKNTHWKLSEEEEFAVFWVAIKERWRVNEVLEFGSILLVCRSSDDFFSSLSKKLWNLNFIIVITHMSMMEEFWWFSVTVSASTSGYIRYMMRMIVRYITEI